jgi:hypothetical protein
MQTSSILHLYICFGLCWHQSPKGGDWKGNRVKPFPKWFWWLNCPTQIIGLTICSRIYVPQVPKVHNKPIQSYKKGFKWKEQWKSKAALVWRTGLSGAPSDSVRSTRVDQLQLASFGFSGSLSAIIHRTVRWSTGLSGLPSGVTATTPTVVCKSNSEQCATARAESE